MPDVLPYAPPPSQLDPREDRVARRWLKALEVCHYAWGGFVLFSGGSLFGGFLLGFGAGEFPDNAMIALQIAVLAYGGFVFYCGRCVANRTRRARTFACAGVNCVLVWPAPLGLFSFVLLTRPSVLRLYNARLASGP